MDKMIYVANLEAGMPTVDVALRQLDMALARAKSSGYAAIKVIHGYGSSGKGGRIKAGVAQHLQRAKTAGRIKAWCSGEEFTPFNADVQAMLRVCFGLSRDKDYMKCNHGISIVLL